MKKKTSLTIIFLLLFQISFSQNKDVKILIKDASEAFNRHDYEKTLQKIEEIKIEFKKNTPPPSILSMEILSMSEIIKMNPYESFNIIDETRNLINSYLKNKNSINDKNYYLVIEENKILDTYPKDLVTFNIKKELKEKAAKEEKERLEREAIAAKEKEEYELKKRVEEEKLKKLIANRKLLLLPYIKAISISDYELGRLTEVEFNEKLNKAKVDIIKIEKEIQRINEIKNKRLTLLGPNIIFVKKEDINNLGNCSDYRFEEIYKAAKNDAKIAKKNNKPQMGSFSSIGLQSGEIATYGLIYEHGGNRTVGFRFLARTSLTPEEDILSGEVVKNKTELELGPNFKIFKRLYLNLGVGYGYYDKLVNNDYSGELFIEKTGYSVASAGLMIRISKIININGGASFMDIEKEFYKPEITFGISFNLQDF